jgi:hypothetical protein
MRTALLSLVAAACLSGADVRVDHITFAGPNLADLMKMFADAGIPTEYGGRHSNGITEMALSAFPDGSYLELIAPIAGADASPHYWWPFMSGKAGPCAWAMRSMDLAPSIARLRGAGIAVHAEKAGRKRPDGVELKWETATVGPPPQGSFFPFMIADETPRDLRVYPQRKPTTTSISGVRFVVVAVRNLPEAIAKYRAAFEFGEPQQQDDPRHGAHLAWFPGSPAILAAPINDDTWLARRLKQFGEVPCAFIFASSEMKGSGGDSNWFTNRIIWLDPKTVADARIGFVAAK